MRLEIRIMASLVKRGVQPLKATPDATRRDSGLDGQWLIRHARATRATRCASKILQGSLHLATWRFPCEKNPDGPEIARKAIFWTH